MTLIRSAVLERLGHKKGAPSVRYFTREVAGKLCSECCQTITLASDGCECGRAVCKKFTHLNWCWENHLWRHGQEDWADRSETDTDTTEAAGPSAGPSSSSAAAALPTAHEDADIQGDGDEEERRRKRRPRGGAKHCRKTTGEKDEAGLTTKGAGDRSPRAHLTLPAVGLVGSQHWGHCRTPLRGNCLLERRSRGHRSRRPCGRPRHEADRVVYVAGAAAAG